MVDHRRLRYYSSVFGAREVKRRMAEQSEDTLSVCSVSTTGSSQESLYLQNTSGGRGSGHSQPPPSPSGEHCISSLAHYSTDANSPSLKEQQLVERILVGLELIGVVQTRLIYQKVVPEHRCKVRREMAASLILPARCGVSTDCKATCRELLHSASLLNVRNEVVISQISHLTAKRLQERILQDTTDSNVVLLASRSLARLLEDLHADGDVDDELRRAADVHLHTFRTIESSTCHEQRKAMGTNMVELLGQRRK